MAATDHSDLLIVLDFDRTIFDTHRYYQDFLAMVAGAHGADFATEMKAAESTSQYFDPFGYLQGRGVSYDAATASFHDYHHAKYAGRAEGSYLFADAAPFIQHATRRPATAVAILTTGTIASQRFKLSLCPELAHLPHDIVAGNKGVHLQQLIDAHSAVPLAGKFYQRIVLVDDRDDVLAHIRPHQGHQLFHIVRLGSKYQPTISRSDITEISTLSAIIPSL